MTPSSQPLALVVGASGATGRLLVEQLLNRGFRVRVVVRSALPENLRGRDGVEVVTASLLDLSDEELRALVEGCSGIASCLGHNLSFRGLFGPPWRLVTEAARRLCSAARTRGEPVRFVLMNTTGNRNRGLDEPISFAQKIVIGLLRALLPPHADNEAAAEFLRSEVGAQDPAITWAAVRPDGLVDEDEVSAYTLHPSPTRSAIFDAGKTSRINVANFMARLLHEDELWAEWKGQMPVIYNESAS